MYITHLDRKAVKHVKITLDTYSKKRRLPLALMEECDIQEHSVLVTFEHVKSILITLISRVHTFIELRS